MRVLKQQIQQFGVFFVKSLMAILFVTISMAVLAVPQTMTYQGVLPEGTASPLSMEVRLYDSANGGA